jgi:hypothetical protein
VVGLQLNVPAAFTPRRIPGTQNYNIACCFYGYGTWSLTLREESRLRVFEKRVLRKIFGPKRDEVTREWREIHNEKLHGLYFTRDIVRVIKSGRMRWGEHVACIGERRGAYRVFGGESM